MTQAAVKASNLRVASNVWIYADNPQGEIDNTCWDACRHMPGDLRVKMSDMRNLDKRAIEQAIALGRMTRKQRSEMLAFRFFLPHTHTEDDLVVRDRTIAADESRRIRRDALE